MANLHFSNFTTISINDKVYSAVSYTHLLDYFKRRCFHHNVGQPDTPSSVFGFILVLHLMFFQQAAGIHIQMFGEPVHCHIRLNRLGQLSGTAFPFSVINRYDLRHSFQYRVRRLLPKLILCMVKVPNQTLLVFAQMQPLIRLVSAYPLSLIHIYDWVA